MSSGQLPRTPEFFPRMKYRARKRVPQVWITMYDMDWNVITSWPVHKWQFRWELEASG